MRVYDAKINHMQNPVGFKLDGLTFTWKVDDTAAKKQKSARILIASDADMQNILVDTGMQPELNSLGQKIELVLEPRTRYYWNVTVLGDNGETACSGMQYFETGKMEEVWEAKWIGCDESNKRQPIFDKEIRLRDKVKEARLYICGLGMYEAFYQNKKIGDEYLTPYCNNYDAWVQYQTYDVTELLCEDGTLSAALGNGWYLSRFGFTSTDDDQAYYGDEHKLIAELHITYADGSKEVISTDESWKVRKSAIIVSTIYDGEWVDETLPELPAEAARLCEAPKGILSDRMSPKVQEREVFQPIELIHTPAGELVFDLGQEFTGIFELQIDEPAGTKIHIQTGEVLQQGNFYNANLRTAKSEYYYTTNGGKKTIRPQFTFFGYRYVKVEGVSHLSVDDFKGIALYSELQPVGAVSTGHDLLNRFISNVEWGLKSNFVDVPTDCPQRDERMGWTGDAQVFSTTAIYLKDTYAFYQKYLYDMKLEQRNRDGMVPDVVPSFGVDTTATVWGDASTIIPWNLYVFYGDKSILENQYESMKAWVNYVDRLNGDTHEWRNHWHYGDWVALDNMNGNDEQVMGATDEGFIANLYFAVSASILAKAANVLGMEEDAAYYKELSEKQFGEVKKEYYSVTGRCCIKTQTALLLTLKYNLSDNRDLILRQLRKLFTDNQNHLTTGFVGTSVLNNVLTDNGMADLAYKLLLNEEYPGWLREVKLGATTIWERWNSLLDDGTISGIMMNSLNHYSYGSVLEWVFRHVAGINVCEEYPGAKRVSIEPLLNWELGHVDAHYDSAAGRYEVNWNLPDYDHVSIRIKVPFGCTALVTLPLSGQEPFELTAGEYEYSYKLTESLKLVYSLDTPVYILQENEDVVKALNGIVDFGRIPPQFVSSSLREMAESGFGGQTKVLMQLEKVLAAF